MISSPNEILNIVYHYYDALLQFPLKLKLCKPHKGTLHPRICDVINDVKLFSTMYRMRTYRQNNSLHIKWANMAKRIIEPQHKISNNVVCATSNGSDQPAQTHILISAFVGRFNSLRLLGH